jgi:hypothetical protein
MMLVMLVLILFCAHVVLLGWLCWRPTRHIVRRDGWAAWAGEILSGWRSD